MAGNSTHSLSPARQLNYWLALALGVFLTLSAGVLYGQYSQRWGPPADLTAAARRTWRVCPIRLAIGNLPKSRPWQIPLPRCCNVPAM